MHTGSGATTTTAAGDWTDIWDPEGDEDRAAAVAIPEGTPVYDMAAIQA